jgi:hypothetical protein
MVFVDNPCGWNLLPTIVVELGRRKSKLCAKTLWLLPTNLISRTEHIIRVFCANDTCTDHVFIT